MDDNVILKDARAKNDTGAVSNILVELFQRDPTAACSELGLEKPITRLRFVLRLRRITSRKFASAIGSDEHYVSRCLNTGSGFTRMWGQISIFLRVPQEWLATGKATPGIAAVLKGETYNSTVSKQIFPRHTPHTIIPIQITEPVFGYNAGALLYCEERLPLGGERVIFEMNDGSSAARWIILPDASRVLGHDAGMYLVGFATAAATFSKIDSSTVHTIKTSDIRRTFVVVGRRDCPLTNDHDVKVLAGIEANMPDDAEDGGPDPEPEES